MSSTFYIPYLSSKSIDFSKPKYSLHPLYILASDILAYVFILIIFLLKGLSEFPSGALLLSISWSILHLSTIYVIYLRHQRSCQEWNLFCENSDEFCNKRIFFIINEIKMFTNEMNFCHIWSECCSLLFKRKLFCEQWILFVNFEINFSCVKKWLSTMKSLFEEWNFNFHEWNWFGFIWYL